MATETEKKISPIQSQINDIQGEVSVLTDGIASANSNVSYYNKVINSTYTATKSYQKLWTQSNNYFKSALQVAHKTLAKNRKVCGSAYYDNVCKEAQGWKNEVDQWKVRLATASADLKSFKNKKNDASNIVADLTAEKLSKQSEIADLQSQIDDIIANDIKIAATDPMVLAAAEESKADIAKIEEEGKQRNLVILGILVIIVVFGSIILFRK